MQEFNNLRDVLDAHCGSLKDLTVLALANDPFRVDTDSGHRDGVLNSMQRPSSTRTFAEADSAISGWARAVGR